MFKFERCLIDLSMLPELAENASNYHERQLLEISYFISPSKLFVRREYYKEKQFRSAKFIENQKHLLNNSQNGAVSNKASKKIRSAIEWLTASAQTKLVFVKDLKRNVKFKVNFITLTLPSSQGQFDDKFVKKHFLAPFIKRLKRRNDVSNYVWKAETQKNGNIHFHIVTDKFIHYMAVRNMWNDVLRKNGLLKEFASKHGHSNANSSDIHSVKNVNNLAAYLIKYFTKNDSERRNIDGRLWGCSYSLSRANSCKISVSANDIKTVTKGLSIEQLKYNSIESKPDSMGNSFKIGDMYYINPGQWGVDIKGKIFQEYTEHCAQIRSGNDLFFAEKKQSLRRQKQLKINNIEHARALNAHIINKIPSMDYSKYPPNWNDTIRPEVLKRANYKCQKCKVNHRQLGYRSGSGAFHAILPEAKQWAIDMQYKPFVMILQVAHLDHDTTNNVWENLMALCPQCHNRNDKVNRQATRIMNAKKKQLKIDFNG